jgi:hypothetical protein
LFNLGFLGGMTILAGLAFRSAFPVDVDDAADAAATATAAAAASLGVVDGGASDSDAMVMVGSTITDGRRGRPYTCTSTWK